MIDAYGRWFPDYPGQSMYQDPAYLRAIRQQPYQNAQNVPAINQNTQQAQTPAQTANAQQSANNGLVWVQGMEGAKAHFVTAGATVMLMDSEGDRFYLKSSDMSGMPLPLRVFEYKEVTQSGATVPAPAMDTSAFVTHKEFDELRRSVDALTAKKAPAKRKDDVENG